MTEEINIHVGEDIEEMGVRFVRAWKKAESGQAVNQRHLTFATMEELSRCFTGKRMELLSYLKEHKCVSVRDLGRQVGRDIKNISTDIRALIDAGVITKDKNGLHTEVDVIHTSITI